MRLWSLHPVHLDGRGLVALWREGLLAQAVVKGKTKGYQHHPQLVRFHMCSSPLGAIAEYLRFVHTEAVARSYKFDHNKIESAHFSKKITVTHGQLQYEWEHLLNKLSIRDSEHYSKLKEITNPRPHPLFTLIPGDVEDWEKGAD